MPHSFLRPISDINSSMPGFVTLRASQAGQQLILLEEACSSTAPINAKKGAFL